MSARESDIGPLWHFALRLYAVDEVRAACLMLQDDFDADVPAMLFAAWAGARGSLLNAAEFARIDAARAPWREEVIEPLRMVRRRLRTGPAPAPSGVTATLRETVKRAELEAERIALAEWEAAGASLPRGADPQGAVRGNLATALAHYSPDAEAGAALERLARAAA